MVPARQVGKANHPEQVSHAFQVVGKAKRQGNHLERLGRRVRLGLHGETQSIGLLGVGRADAGGGQM